MNKLCEENNTYDPMCLNNVLLHSLKKYTFHKGLKSSLHIICIENIIKSLRFDCLVTSILSLYSGRILLAHRVPGSNSALGKTLFKPKWHFISQIPS